MNKRTLQQLESPNIADRKQAIRQLALSRDIEALPYLKDVFRNDPDAQVRQLARKAGAYIKKHHKTPVFILDDTPEVDNTPMPSDIKVSATAAERARTYFSQAFDMEVRGQKARGILLLQKAFRTDPRLTYDSTARTLASSLTGLPEEEAVRQIKHGATVSVKREPILNARRIKILFMMIAGVGMLVSFFLPYLNLFEIGDYTPTQILQNEDQIGTVLSFSPETRMITIISGVSPILYTVAAIGIIGALQAFVALYFLLSDESPRWYWLIAVALAIFSVVPFMWLYTQLDNLFNLLEYAVYNETSGTLMVEFPVQDFLAYGYWIGVVCAGLMIGMAVLGLIFDSNAE
ncbi:MAG: hypothetical protein D6711_07500 [Chloroflexi bacterium]|nr:MAG: hypothetical protein D6711_07500 [Chloroflexota bacterium]